MRDLEDLLQLVVLLAKRNVSLELIEIHVVNSALGQIDDAVAIIAAV